MSNISKALQSLGIFFGFKHLFPNMGKGRRLLFFLAVNEGLAIMEDPEGYVERFNKSTETIKERWRMQDPDYALSKVTKVRMGP
jgi:hypothetical protein